MERLRASSFDLLLMDLNYTRDTTSGREGLELISRVRAHDPSLPIVVMTGWGSIDTAVEAMRRGAKSFVQKPWEDVTLLEIVEREVNEGRAARRRDHKQQREAEEVLATQVVNDLLGSDPAARVALVRGKLRLAQFSRNQELEADAIGIRATSRAGYDPFAAARFLQSMAAYSASRSVTGWLRM